MKTTLALEVKCKRDTELREVLAIRRPVFATNAFKWDQKNIL